MKPQQRSKLQFSKTTLRNLKAADTRRVRGGTVLCLDSSGGDNSGGRTCVSCFQDSHCYC
jgi:hypothetical protein